MPATIPDLWPDDIKVDVLPPLAILKDQAAKIREKTKGILRAEVTTTTGQDDFVVHRLELVAPQLGNRRYGVLNVTHRTDFYPVVLEADCFQPKGPLRAGVETFGVLTANWPRKGDWRPVAHDQDEFLKRLGEVLKSGEVRAAIDSMIALSNAKERAPDDPGGNEAAA